MDCWNGNADDSSLYRKSGGDYYQLFDPGFDVPVLYEYIFLKDNTPAGTAWQSPVFSGTISGIPASFYSKMTLLEYAVPVSVGGINFPDVIKIKYEYVNSSQSIITASEMWFAKDGGLIKMLNIGSNYLSIFRIPGILVIVFSAPVSFQYYQFISPLLKSTPSVSFPPFL